MTKTSETIAKLEYLQNKFMNVLQLVSENHMENEKVQDSENGWTAIEMLRHVPVTETEVLELMKEVVSGSGGVSEDFDIDKENAVRREVFQNLEIEEIKTKMDEIRHQTCDFIKNTNENDWSKEGRYYNHEIMTIERMLGIIMWHQNHHLKNIIEKLSFDL